MSRAVFWSHRRFFGNNCHGHSKKVMGKKTLNFELLDFPQLFTRAKKKNPYISLWKFRTRTQCFQNNPYPYPSTHHNLTLNFFRTRTRTQFSKKIRTRHIYAPQNQNFSVLRTFYVFVPRYGCVDVDGIRLRTPDSGVHQSEESGVLIILLYDWCCAHKRSICCWWNGS